MRISFKEIKSPKLKKKTGIFFYNINNLTQTHTHSK